MTGQLGFNLQPAQPYSLSYFVPHSGVGLAVCTLEQAIGMLLGSGKSAVTPLFQSCYLYGPDGSGKRHLCEGYRIRAVELGLSEQCCAVFDFVDEDPMSEERVTQFVSCYERLKSNGGLLLSFGMSDPWSLSKNPHLSSRLLAGEVIALSYPREPELRPLLSSLSERRNLKLSERTLDYLVRRIPLDPLSFDMIFDTISRISLTEGKPAGLGVVRQALEEELGKQDIGGKLGTNN